MHILDLIMLPVIIGIIWFLLDIIGGGELTEELGGLIGLLIIFIVGVVYIILFWIGPYNWVDIFNSASFNVNLKL